MSSVLVLTVVQMVLVYAQSDYSGTSPAKVSSLVFAQSQNSLEWYSFLSMRSLFIEQGAFFIFVGAVLYTAIFFLISVINDLATSNNLMYLEGSSTLEQEKKRLRIIMLVFGTSYFLRAAFDFAIAGFYLQFQTLTSDFAGFFELLQSIYFIITDVLPISSFFLMHHQVYNEEE